MGERKSTKKARRELEEGVRRMGAWCQANFPPRMEVRVAVVDSIDEGETFESLGLAFIDEAHPDMLSIHISADQSTREAMETTMHEWAHALTMPWLQDWQNDHEDYFWIVFGRMYRRWHGQGGQEAAKRL